MSKEFDYTAIAQRFSARFPALTYIITQINFWIIANILLGIILQLQSLSLSQTFEFPGLISFTTVLVITILLGILYGISLGSIDYYFDKNIFRKKPLGKVLLLKTIISLGILILLFLFIRFILFDFVNSTLHYKPGFTLHDKSWKYLFYLVLIYYFFMSLVINFINQVNKKYGPGVLIPLLLGKYRNPREEERIFMFMDLKSSTSLAEELGHLKYSSFIRDCFMDINHVLLPFNAQVYQYVGDEIVLTWKLSDGLKDLSCIRFFFACENYFRDRNLYYTKNYGFLPLFKAGLHLGQVTAVEIGEIKRDIAYHGDTLNTTARIQSACNEYNKKFLVSEIVLEKLGLVNNLSAEPLGPIQLRGKTTKIGIASVDWIEK
ncbi:MAG: adenylate/guanylate cyclase domain-containing protein [Bacteroidetes bacterium]|nr:MAG: adenylate/guanylate cyclase domain-containing protein [Bacteroidota bacterium]